MLSFRSSFNGVQHFFFIHGFRQLTLYSTSISTEVNPNFVSYLVENIGFSIQKALSTFSKLNRQRPRYKEVSDDDFFTNSDSVVAFLRKIGLQQSHIKKTIGIYPQILMCNVDKTLTPKTEIFQKLGFSETDVSEVFSSNPSLLFSGLNSTIVPAINSLIHIMNCNRDVVTVLKKLRCNSISTVPKYLVSNVALLRSYGIPIDSIRRYLLRKPSSFVRSTSFLLNATTRVEEKLGIPRNCPRFLLGFDIVSSLSEKTIESKIGIYKSFGWTDSEVAAIVSSFPCALAYSEDGIKKKLGYLMNEVGCEASYLASNGKLLTCSLEKRVLPRHKVFLVLKERGLIRANALTTMVSYPEPKFLEKFILPYKEVHEVYSKHAGISLEVLSRGSSKLNSRALGF